MELSLENIYGETEPYTAFVNSIKNQHTFRKYKNHLYRFLKSIPISIFKTHLGYEPESDSIEILSRCFVELAQKNSSLAQSVVSAYVKQDKKLVEDNMMSPNTFPSHIKPIRKLLDVNGVAIHWKSIHCMFPREQVSKDRAYTREELQRMLDVTSDVTDKVIVTMFSSAGFRLEAWDYFTWKDLVFFKNNNDSYKGAALLIYRGDPESYWSFITPEACKYLDEYKEYWKSAVGRYPRPDEPLLKVVKTPMVRRLNSLGIKKRILRMSTKIGLRPNLTEGKRRHEVQLAHGFRKYCNTMMRRAKIDYLDKEDIMGHKVGLEKHYERYVEADFERFTEYQKAIPFLTISDDERTKVENQKLKQEKSELEELKSNMEKAIQEKMSQYNEHFLEEMEKFYDEQQSMIKLVTDKKSLEILKKLAKNKEDFKLIKSAYEGKEESMNLDIPPRFFKKSRNYQE